MDAKQIISELKALGLTEYEIAKRLKTVSQSTINRIATGKTPGTSYRVWRELSNLLADLTIVRPRKPSHSRAAV